MTSEERQLFQELLKFVEEAELTSDEYARTPGETEAEFAQAYPGIAESRQKRELLIRSARDVLGQATDDEALRALRLALGGLPRPSESEGQR